MTETINKKLDKLRYNLGECKKTYKMFRKLHGDLMNKADIVMNNVQELAEELEEYTKKVEYEKENNLVKLATNEYGYPETKVGDEIEFENGEIRLVLVNNMTLDRNGVTRNWDIKIMKYKIINNININGIF